MLRVNSSNRTEATRRYDSLERAVKEAPAGVTDVKVQKFINGIVMTEKIMLQVIVSALHLIFSRARAAAFVTRAQVFQRQGISKMTSLNQKFDPNIHGAMFETESTTVEPGARLLSYNAFPASFSRRNCHLRVQERLPLQRARVAARPGRYRRHSSAFVREFGCDF